jgi:hypothetical protein
MSQQNQSTLQSAINTQLADNTSGAISAADVRDNLINMTDSLLFNSGSQGITGSLTATSFTGSLQGTATTASYVVTAQTASYVAGANVVGAVTLATDAGNAARVYTSKVNTNGDYKVTFTDNLSLDDNSDLYKDQDSTFLYNPGLNRLTVGTVSASAGFTGSLLGTATTASYALTASMLLGSVTSASYAATASLSEETIGAGLYGGEIQFRGGTGPGKNTYASAFTWNLINDGLNIGDPNSTAGNGTYYLALGVESLANGNYSVAFGSSSLAQGEGTFTHGQEVTATAPYSHAEGYSTVTLGQFSHAEGYNTTATGNNSHAEGANTTSTGLSSHAEGILTNAQGSYSHAEGQTTIALGQGSHAEGLGTVASGSFQHVQGQYNTPGDTTSLMIVGNGTFGTPSDAFKVRMSGSIVLPTTQSTAPSWTGTDGEMVFATVTGNHFFYVWMAGAWRSGSLS